MLLTPTKPVVSNPHNTFGKGHQTRSVNGGSDAYFTRPEVARLCTAELMPLLRKWRISTNLFFEPAAGNGVWLDALPKRCLAVAYDISPRSNRVQQADFFNLKVPANCIVIGNPPFGFAAKLAVEFFNHAASNARAIAFILPKTFRKASVQCKLNPSFHLELDIDLPAYSFSVDDIPHDVPCCFQVWRRMIKPRNIQLESIANPWLEFVTPRQADFAVRRVGGKAGQVLIGLDHSVSSTYFIRAKTDKKELIRTLNRIDFSVINHTAGVRSLSKRELVSALRHAMEKR